jgi:prepilin-type N-terminal cleavage/methylation domain-containing protein
MFRNNLGKNGKSIDEFKPGLALGIASIHGNCFEDQSVFTVIEGPERNQATFKGSFLVGTMARSLEFTLTLENLADAPRAARRITRETEGLRAIGRDAGAEFELVVDDHRVRVIVYPDVYNSDNLLISVVDVHSEMELGTVTYHRLATGFTLLELVAVVVVVAVLGAATIAIAGRLKASAEKVEIDTGETKVNIGGAKLELGDTVPISSSTVMGQ